MSVTLMVAAVTEAVYCAASEHLLSQSCIYMLSGHLTIEHTIYMYMYMYMLTVC